VFARLTRLNLTGNDFGDAGLLRLLDSPNAAGLESLAPGGLRVTEEGISALAAAEHLTALRHLDLTGVRLTSAAAQALARTRLPRRRAIVPRRAGHGLPILRTAGQGLPYGGGRIKELGAHSAGAGRNRTDCRSPARTVSR